MKYNIKPLDVTKTDRSQYTYNVGFLSSIGKLYISEIKKGSGGEDVTLLGPFDTLNEAHAAKMSIHEQPYERR